MFDQSILARPAKTRRTWTVLASFCLQGIVIGTGVLIPLVFTDGIPMARLAPFRIEAPRPRPRPAGPRDHVQLVPANRPTARRPFTAPVDVPRGVSLKDPPQRYETPDEPACPWCPTVGEGPVARNTVPWGIGPVPKYEPQVEPPPKKDVPVTKPEAKPTPRIRIGAIDPALVIDKVVPVYPPLAKRARISGMVRLQALIGTDGRIRELRLISGHPLLAQAALDAVQQWRYRPTILNGDPVEVVTAIYVHFTLAQ